MHKTPAHPHGTCKVGTWWGRSDSVSNSGLLRRDRGCETGIPATGIPEGASLRSNEPLYAEVLRRMFLSLLSAPAAPPRR